MGKEKLESIENVVYGTKDDHPLKHVEARVIAWASTVRNSSRDDFASGRLHHVENGYECESMGNLST